jgi:hydrogenase-4 component F
MVKVALFLAVGNIHRTFGHRTVPEVSGAIRRLPLTGWLFLLGFLASACSPPFGPFMGAFRLVSTAFGAGRMWVGGLFLTFLAMIFLASSGAILTATLGRDNRESGSAGITHKDAPRVTIPIVAALVIALVMGVWMPQPLSDLLDSAVATLAIP